MLFHLNVQGKNATELGYLLGKHPDKHQTKALSFGQAHIFYPEATDQSCSACLLLDIDSTKEMRQQRKDNFGRNANLKAGFDQYVNDRAYVASSLLCSAIAKVYGSALNGNCNIKPELVSKYWSLEATLAAVCVRGEARLINRLFEPLGYTVEYQASALDSKYPEWGQSPYYSLTLKGHQRVQSLLQHLYILLPILENRKHYYFKEDEIEKLLAKAAAWLPEHPEKELITQRYFGRKSSYQKAVFHAAANEEVIGDANQAKRSPSLHQQRHEIIAKTLLERNVKTVLDLGCSTGKLLQCLQTEKSFTRLTGVDVAISVLQQAAQKLGLRRRGPESAAPRIQLIQGALTYQDQRFHGYDAALLVEVIEHLDPERLPALEQVVFQYAAPQHIMVTTPNVEYNVLYPDLPAGQFRHPDHRFEWDRNTFLNWVKRLAASYNYSYEIGAIGENHEHYGSPSQMAIFTKTRVQHN